MSSASPQAAMCSPRKYSTTTGVFLKQKWRKLKVEIRGQLDAGFPAGAGQPGLFGTGQRRRGPVEGVVHGLTHLIEPPRGALHPALSPGGGGEASAVRETEFHLCVCHIVYLSVFASRLAEGVGQPRGEGPKKTNAEIAKAETLKVRAGRAIEGRRAEIRGRRAAKSCVSPGAHEIKDSFLCARRAIHANVVVVACRSRRARRTFCWDRDCAAASGVVHRPGLKTKPRKVVDGC